METSQPLTTESFSYSWITNKEPSFDYTSDEEETYSIVLSRRFLEEADDINFDLPVSNSIFFKDNEETYSIVNSRRFLEEADSFNFDLPLSNSADNTLIHADEIFVNGHILPLYFDTKTSPSTIQIPSFSSKTVYFTPNKRKKWHFFGKWKSSSKRVLFKCLRLLVPRKSIRVDDIDRKVWEIKSLSSSVQSSPQRNMTCSSSSGDCLSKRTSKMKKAKSWSSSPRESPVRILPYSYSSKDACFDRESSVYEAVLHCKRSFGEGNG